MARRSILFRLASDPVCRLWSGHGDLVTPSDYVDAGGATWLGAAQLLNVPALRALINGNAERVRFSLSGVNAETLRLAREDANTVYRAEVRLGHVEFDDDWQVTSVEWSWRGIADMITVEHSAGQDGLRNRSIHLSVGAADTARANPQATYWTAQSQRQHSPDDAICDPVASISQGMTRRFGPK